MTPQQIVADLRAQVVIHELTGNAGMQRVVTASAAADTIEAQQAEIERLREALGWYANPAIYAPHPHGPAFDRRDVSYVARAALEVKP